MIYYENLLKKTTLSISNQQTPTNYKSSALLLLFGLC